MVCREVGCVDDELGEEQAEVDKDGHDEDARQKLLRTVLRYPQDCRYGNEGEESNDENIGDVTKYCPCVVHCTLDAGVHGGLKTNDGVIKDRFKKKPTGGKTFDLT